MFFVALAVAAYILYRCWPYFKSPGRFDHEPPIILVAGVMVVWLLVSGFMAYGGDGADTYKEYDVAALNLGTETEGAFFLASGKFSDNAKFYAYVESEPGSEAFRLREFDKDNVLIHTSNASTPKMIAACSQNKKVKNFWTYPFTFGDNVVDCDLDRNQVTFIVPAGAVVSGPNINLDNLKD